MPHFTAADTIRVLVATDNHVGYNERDAERGNDSWKSFDEIMNLARERDVDMVLLAGDLFHENKPSRQAMYQVMRSLRANCLGDKPCELQMIGDESEHFAGSFNHVNYNDRDINVAIPVFSIHGNHDDPSGEGHLAALDILAMSGLLNYYGRTPEADNIEIKPILLQKGQTKLALYGMSNVRDERLFRTFRENKVKWFRPNAQSGDFFNIVSVHQNHHAYTTTNYLPEQYIPSYMDLVIWGHEHECKIDPSTNATMGFKVMQPGSSVATSLCPGEAVPKHVAILNITGTDMEVETIRLKTVRPFIMKEIVLKDYQEMEDLAFKTDNGPRVTQFLTRIVKEMIEEAQQEWLEIQEENGREIDEDEQPPLPLVRLRVECTPPEGGSWTLENPQRFSGRFTDWVANNTDVVQFHRKKSGIRKTKHQQPDDPEEEIMAQITIDDVNVDELVNEFLSAQSLTILPQNRFSESVNQFVAKDDRNAMENFLQENLDASVKDLTEVGNEDDDTHDFDDDLIQDAIENFRVRQEEAHARGELKKANKKSLRPKPDEWDSDEDGHWADSAMAIMVNEDAQQKGANDDDDDDAASVVSASRPARGRGSHEGRSGKAAAGTTRKAATTAAAKKAPAKSTGRKKKKLPSNDEDSDVIMIDDDDDDESQSQGLFVSQTTAPPRTQRAASPAKKAVPKATRGRAAAANGTGSSRQTRLSFGSSQVNGTGRSTATSRTAAPSKRLQPSEDEISDDDDAFEPPPAAQRSGRTGRR